MPWDTRIFDITHDYYNRIFEDSRDDGNMTAAFQNILMGNSLTDEQTDTIINYRLRIIKEELEYGLSNAEVRFQLMAAYKLREIRKV